LTLITNNRKYKWRFVEATAVDGALRALADANRRAILFLVRDEPLAVGDIAARVDVTQQAVSHHLGVLKKAGLVDETRDGTRHLFAIRTDGFAAVQTYLDSFWPTKLVALKKAVENAARDAARGIAKDAANG
jgi:DNA-binding transcriptional ArsR family regulator